MAIGEPVDGAGDLLVGKLVARLGFEGAELGVCVLGIVMGDVPVAGANLIDEVDGMGEGGVTPSFFVDVFFGGVLDFMDEEVAAAVKVDVGGRGRGGLFVIGDVGDGLMGSLDFEAVGGAGMFGGMGVDEEGTDGDGFGWGEGAEGEVGVDLFKLDGEELAAEELLKEFAAGAVGTLRGPNGDVSFGTIDGLEEGKADDVIPVGVAEEKGDVGVAQVGAEGTDAGAGVDDEKGVVIAHFKTAGVAAKVGIVGSAD